MKCPFYSFDVNKPCGLQECSCFISNEENKNCLHYYINNNGTSNISKTQLSSWHKVPSKKIEECVEKVLNDIRISKVESLLSPDNDLEFVENSGVCVCCHNVCKTPIPLYKNSPLCYCSFKCAARLPAKLVLLMQRLGSDEKSVIIALVRAFPGSIIKDMLGLTETELKSLFYRLFNVKISITNESFDIEYDFETSKYSPVKLSRRYALIDDELYKEAVIVSGL